MINIFNELKKAFKIFTLDSAAIVDVANNSPAWLAAVFFGVWGFISSISLFDWITAVGNFIGTIILSYIFVFVLYLIAKLFSSKSQFYHLYKPFGYVALLLGSVSLLILIPTAGIWLCYLLCLWSLIILTRIIEVVYLLKRWKAIACILIAALLFSYLAYAYPSTQQFMFKLMNV